MHEWLSGGVSPCQGEGRGFESRLVLLEDPKINDFRIFLCMGFSLLRAFPFFVDPKNGNARNQNPPAMRVETNCYTKNHLSATIELFRHYCKKGKVILWQKRITI